MNKLLLITGLFLTPMTVWALEDGDIPTEAPHDAVMASPAEIQAIHDWVSEAFSDRRSGWPLPSLASGTIHPAKS
jgi:hypothetical protein